MTNKRETLNIRIKPEERNLIDRAARVRGKNHTDFILDAVRSAAEETLYNQTIILTSPEAYAKFLAQLDMQPAISQRAFAQDDANACSVGKGVTLSAP